ncbi:MAG: LytR C-terminal domain-containing protein [Ignavibacteria bacterium]|nr:LytR C-terminal domain-containing protein [Ignavibacteria bacterium]
MKILSDNKIGNLALILGLSLCVVLMLSSFITRIITPPVETELDLDTQPTNEIEQVIQVNVLNACGKAGLARNIQNFLMERGYDVVSIGNYDQELDNSIVIDRLGDMSSANKVAYALGVDETSITSGIDSTMFVRATVIVGKDYLQLKPFNY